jgi:WD40 repeat protein
VDGRFVAFEFGADDLVSNDSNLEDDVFVRDRKNGITRLVSLSSGEIQGNGLSRAASVSANGRYVAFMSDSTTFVAADDSPGRDIYLRDRRRGTTRLLSVKTSGRKGNGPSIFPRLTPDGRFVVFASDAKNLFRKDVNANSDVFVRGPLHE